MPLDELIARYVATKCLSCFCPAVAMMETAEAGLRVDLRLVPVRACYTAATLSFGDQHAPGLPDHALSRPATAVCQSVVRVSRGRELCKFHLDAGRTGAGQPRGRGRSLIMYTHFGHGVSCTTGRPMLLIAQVMRHLYSAIAPSRSPASWSGASISPFTRLGLPGLCSQPKIF